MKYYHPRTHRDCSGDRTPSVETVRSVTRSQNILKAATAATKEGRSRSPVIAFGARWHFVWTKRHCTVTLNAALKQTVSRHTNLKHRRTINSLILIVKRTQFSGDYAARTLMTSHRYYHSDTITVPPSSEHATTTSQLSGAKNMLTGLHPFVTQSSAETANCHFGKARLRPTYDFPL